MPPLCGKATKYIFEGKVLEIIIGVVFVRWMLMNIWKCFFHRV